LARCLQFFVAFVPTAAANISAIAVFPGDVAGAVSVDSAVPILIPAVGIAWAPAVVIVSAGSCIPAAAVGVLGVPPLGRVSAVAAVLAAADVSYSYNPGSRMLLMPLLLLTSMLMLVSLLW
jgi:hypothetical protein